MDFLKVGDGRQCRGGDRNHHHGDAKRPRRDTAQRGWRDGTAERDPQHDRTGARERSRDLNCAARKRRNRGEHHRAGEPAGRKFRGIEQESAGRPDQQGGGEAGERRRESGEGCMPARSMPHCTHGVKPAMLLRACACRLDALWLGAAWRNRTAARIPAQKKTPGSASRGVQYERTAREDLAISLNLTRSFSCARHGIGSMGAG